MIDFHSHILPGIDDGSVDMEISIKMIDISISEGVECICATPHFLPEEVEIKREFYFSKLEELRNAVKKKNIEIISGVELYINPTLPKLYKENKIWGINNKNYMLIELPMQYFPLYTEEVFYELRILGITPILAHPERNFEILKNPNLLVNLINQGALAQMNSGSLTGRYGSKIEEFSKQLVKRNLIHLLGSDGHNISVRKPRIKQGFEKLKELNHPLYLSILENEKKVIQGVPIETLPIVDYKEGLLKSIFSVFKRS
ncbi:CpsB/CapC family capsule biosynthesis tyrosine phosphatase [Clostridium sp.]|uniref:tyrosine-protein phosphatase n=1 Tax=Clostridium sp. TaxID=1506 RepID=UPI002FCC0F48